MKMLWPDVTEQNQGLSLMHDTTISVGGNRFLLTGFQLGGAESTPALSVGVQLPWLCHQSLNAPKVHLLLRAATQLSTCHCYVKYFKCCIIHSPFPQSRSGEWGICFAILGEPHSAPHYTEVHRNLTLLLFLGLVVQYLLIHDFIEYNYCK